MVSRRQTFAQQDYWHLQIPQEQKKRKTKKQESKNPTTIESVVELIQNAEQVGIPSPPRQDIHIGHVSPPDPRITYYEFEQEREMSVCDAENEI